MLSQFLYLISSLPCSPPLMNLTLQTAGMYKILSENKELFFLVQFSFCFNIFIDSLICLLSCPTMLCHRELLLVFIVLVMVLVINFTFYSNLS
jgi:hypothetical protein